MKEEAAQFLKDNFSGKSNNFQLTRFMFEDCLTRFSTEQLKKQKNVFICKAIKATAKRRTIQLELKEKDNRIKELEEVVDELMIFAHHYSNGVKWEEIPMLDKDKLINLTTKQ